MFGKLIRKDSSEETPPSETASAADEATAWRERLAAAIGNDDALLDVATGSPSLELKLAAVQALSGEEALRRAEREFREHDRRVHTLAKQRHETLVRQRLMRAKAGELIESATALARDAAIPANRLVELDHAWREIDAELIEETQRTAFAAARAQLAQRVQERGERQRAIALWTAQARRAMEALAVRHAEVALAGTADRMQLEAAVASARTALTAVPEPREAMAELERTLQDALHEAEALEVRLAVLEQLDVPDAAEAALERWNGLAPLADRRAGQALEARMEKWRQGRDESRKKRESQERREAAQEDRAERQARSRSLHEAAQAVEDALSAGQLADAVKRLTALESRLGAEKIEPALRARIERLQGEAARLKGWQRWGGGRARDDLVAEAEALTSEDAGRKPRVPLAELEKSIEQLRARWKELDRLGGATSKSLWQRFDAALKKAHEPVAAHAERLKQARRENLAARERLLAGLDAASIEGREPGAAPDWKEVARLLADFQGEWRKLGPLEHAVPHKAVRGLQERMKASVARLETPLKEARRGAQAERENMIARAKALIESPHERYVVEKIRALQAEWQQHARSFPLLRKVENALWNEFKAATAAVMEQRRQAHRARQAGLEANVAAREAVIAGIEALGADVAPAEIKRALAAAEAAWRRCGEAPRERAGALEARFKRARELAQRRVADSARKSWEGTCEALSAKLALCEELEAGARGDPADVEARWAALPPLPAAWETAVHARFKNASAGTADAGGAALDDVLLRLEAALDLPSPESFQAARRSLKLLAMKQALEERRATDAPAELGKLMSAAFGSPRPGEEQRRRLAAVVAALRSAGPGVLRPASR